MCCIANKKISHKESDKQVLQKYSSALPSDKDDQYFKAIKQQLYYTGNNAKVCLTDKMKTLFGSIVGLGDLPHGPYIIVNVDDSKQMLLEKTDIASDKKPVWLKNNQVAFIDSEENLFIADNDEHSTRSVAENISDYVAK